MRNTVVGGSGALAVISVGIVALAACFQRAMPRDLHAEATYPATATPRERSAKPMPLGPPPALGDPGGGMIIPIFTL